MHQYKKRNIVSLLLSDVSVKIYFGGYCGSQTKHPQCARKNAGHPEGLRNEFLVEKVFVDDEYTMVYSHIDRIIVGGIKPVKKTVSVGGEVGKQLGVSYFLERRELGVINIGGPGTITVDGQCFEIGHRDALYVGKGAKEVVFASIDSAKPAKFYYNCAPAHMTFPTKK